MRTAVIVALAGLAIPTTAFAGESREEAIRLVVDAPPECLTEDQLVVEVGRLGGHVRRADEGERARRFDVTIGAERDHFAARLTVRDLVGRETVRSVENATCADAGRSAMLLVSLALDEEPETEPPLREAEPFRWPEPAISDAPAGAAHPRQPPSGSGGVAISGMYGFRNGRPGTEVYGARTYAAWRLGVTRLGTTMAIQRDEDSLPGTSQPASRRGMSGRAGGIIGWGAPWNDSIVGFIGEVGVAAGEMETRESWHGPTTTTERFTRPYAGAWLIFQLPWKQAVRPVIGLGTVWTPMGHDYYDLPVIFAGDLGIVWQAW
jgi:hypothetical protein